MIDRTEERFGLKPEALLGIQPTARRRHSIGS